MSQRESKLSRSIAHNLRLRRNAFCFKVWGNEHMMAGLPDIIGCYRGRFFGLEVKLPESRSNVSVVQERVMSLIDNCEGFTRVIVSIQEAHDALDMLDAMIDQS